MNKKFVYHAPIRTVSNFDESVYLSEEELKEDKLNHLQPMDICYSTGHPYIAIGVVLMGPLNIPYFQDGSGSSYAYKPLDIQNPEEWSATYEAYIVYDLNEQQHKICSAGTINKMAGSRNEGHIPYDNATDKLRCNLALIELANKWWKKEE